MDPLASNTLLCNSVIVSGPLCNKASSAAKSVRQSFVLAMLASATAPTARWLRIRTVQTLAAVIFRLGFNHTCIAIDDYPQIRILLIEISCEKPVTARGCNIMMRQ